MAQVEEHAWGHMEWLSSKVARMRIRPGAQCERHRHPNCDEVLSVQHGDVLCELGTVKVHADESSTPLVIAANLAHRVKNTGPAPAVVGVEYGCTSRLCVPVDESVPFYSYVEEEDIHILDCAGKVDLRLGLERLRRLRFELSARPPRSGVHRLLTDFRHTEWGSQEVHHELSVATRRELRLNPDNHGIRAAFVFPGGKGLATHNEHWFDSAPAAWEWLREGQ